MFLLLRRKPGMTITAIIGIGLSYEPRPSARRLPARRVPQNSARSAEFCTSASPTPHRFTSLVFVITSEKLDQSRRFWCHSTQLAEPFRMSYYLYIRIF
uniref:Uncharacterized protein n=1 Tax=Meloidogyne enterolobii TaxID=390850 RepID=A0A6V7WN50_MELEN|nr:unnamed protein product [Meloidogyne enterolobii]